VIKVYGASDDLIEFRGDIYDEIDCYDEVKKIRFDDGTIIEVGYEKVIDGEPMAIWGIKVLTQGSAFKELQECTDEEADIYSDVLVLGDGVKSYEIISSREKQTGPSVPSNLKVVEKLEAVKLPEVSCETCKKDCQPYSECTGFEGDFIECEGTLVDVAGATKDIEVLMKKIQSTDISRVEILAELNQIKGKLSA